MGNAFFMAGFSRSRALYASRMTFLVRFNPFRAPPRSTPHGSAKAQVPQRRKEMRPLQNSIAIFVLACLTQACAAGSVADLSIYDRTEGRQLQVYWHEGRAYVAGKPGNEYQISLRNRERSDILAVVSVDGVNAITGQSADTTQSGYVLSPGSSMSVQGWRKSLSETAAFYFTALADSYAARTGRPENVGVIGVAIFRR